MGRISNSDRSRNEEAIRAAMDRLLRGDLPIGGRCDLKTLAAEAGVTRTGFYPKKDRDGTIREGPYQHLGEEFVRRLAALREAWEVVDPRDAQIERLKARNAELKGRVADRDKTVEELTAFKKLALSRLAAQQAEIEHLRSPEPPPARLADIPRNRGDVIGSCS
ncbi:hypothetical protein ACFYX8_13920 [Streptomyces cyaneofuscatus]|uniref:hypothetical protein n=1 Tax=Streptomyces TaxID=1883 RepID=UPI00037AD275|nr:MULTISPECIES: hypothetical protein [unclassified Streptomyces]MZF54750.1 hypothetical protein [Streptomyces sp. SID5594]